MSRALWQHAHNQPERAAIIDAQHQRTTYAELEALVARYAGALQAVGLQPKQRVAVFVRPGRELVALMFALLRLGSVPVLIDPGMGIGKAMQALALAQPQALIGVPAAVLASHAWRRTLSCLRMRLVVGHLPFHRSLTRLARTATPLPPGEGHAQDEEAAVLYTSGSTGPAKGVSYTHGNFAAQVEALRLMYGFAPGDIDLACFPLFALFDAALGTTTVFPKMDATRPAAVDPQNILAAVGRFQANQSFGSPALWNTVASNFQTNGQRLPTLRRVLTAGAPVPAHVLRRVREVIAPEGEVFTPYGATEALPVACIESREVLGETAAQTALGRGICVGRKFPRIEWRLIPISDAPQNSLSQTEPIPPGQIGELIVSGPVVTDRYVTRTEANAFHKIADGSRFWHRMGDVGYFDEQERFWFCGRKSHRVQTAGGTLFTIPCEAILNNHPAIYRSALAGVGKPGSQIPVLIAEPWPGKWPANKAQRSQLLKELRELAAESELTRGIEHFFLLRALPVDTRHNSKIFREQLAVWAARQLALPHP